MGHPVHYAEDYCRAVPSSEAGDPELLASSGRLVVAILQCSRLLSEPSLSWEQLSETLAGLMVGIATE